MKFYNFVIIFLISFHFISCDSSYTEKNSVKNDSNDTLNIYLFDELYDKIAPGEISLKYEKPKKLGNGTWSSVICNPWFVVKSTLGIEVAEEFKNNQDNYNVFRTDYECDCVLIVTKEALE